MSAAKKRTPLADDPVMAYVGPYFMFGIVLLIEGKLPQPWASYALPLRGLVPLAIVYFCYRRGAYQELRNLRWSFGGVLLDVLVGLFVAVLWIAPFIFGVLPSPSPDEVFDPNAAGESLALFVLGARLFGFACVTPIFEELFVRSFLHRFIEVYNNRKKDFRDIPIGHFTWPAFLVTVAFFAMTHAPWEWEVAALTCVIWNLLLYGRKTIASTIISHAVTNAALFFFVIFASGRLTGPDGATLGVLNLRDTAVSVSSSVVAGGIRGRAHGY